MTNFDKPALVPSERNEAFRRQRDDASQFAALLAGLREVGLTPEQYASLQAATGMRPKAIDDVLRRADLHADRMKHAGVWRAQAYLHNPDLDSRFDRRVDIDTDNNVEVRVPFADGEGLEKPDGYEPMVAVEYVSGFVRGLAFIPKLDGGKVDLACEEPETFTIWGPVTAEQQERLWRAVQANTNAGRLTDSVFIWPAGTTLGEIRDWFATAPARYALEVFTPEPEG